MSIKSLGTVKFIHTDVASEEMVKTTVDATMQCFERLDLVVNNAGIMIARPISELSLEDWNKVISVNLTGIFLTSKYGVPYLNETTHSLFRAYWVVEAAG